MAKPTHVDYCECSREIGFHTIRDPVGSRECSRCGLIRQHISDRILDVSVEFLEPLGSGSEQYLEAIDEIVCEESDESESR